MPVATAATATPPGNGALPPAASSPDRTCDLAPFPSALWTQCETANFARALAAPLEQTSNPAFQARLLAQDATNLAAWLARATTDPSWLVASPGAAGLLPALNLDTPLTPLCATYALTCAGDPFRWPEAVGSDGQAFYTSEAQVTPVVFYDSGCARITGQVWQPHGTGTSAGAALPGIVIENGSVQASQPLYWWAAQRLVRAGYVVLTFDPRGQGRSDLSTPDGLQGGNLNPSVFWTGLVDAIDFFRASPARPYPNDQTCRGRYPTATAAFNPAFQQIDPQRLGIAGHSLGAIGVSVVQGYGAPGAAPWPGKLDATNPVRVAVAWDGLLKPGGGTIGGAATGGGATALLTQFDRLGLVPAGFDLLIERGLPSFGVRVPALGFSSDYGVAVTPYVVPPDAESHKAEGYRAWTAAATPAVEIGTQGSTHFDYSPGYGLPATSWCPDTRNGACQGGWTQPMVQHYTVAWFDRWLKQPGEPGYADADARLLDDGGPEGRAKMSFRFRSARAFPDRSGVWHRCEDIRAGC